MQKTFAKSQRKQRAKCDFNKISFHCISVSFQRGYHKDAIKLKKTKEKKKQKETEKTLINLTISYF